MTTEKQSLVNRYDYFKLPDGSPRQQLIEGWLVEEPSPTSFHQDIIGNVYHLMREFLGKHPIGRVYLSPLDTYLSDFNVFQPDLFFIRKKNLRIVEEHGIEGAPDLLVEVLSKSSIKYDLGQKRDVYVRAGVEEMWVIDPIPRTVAVYRLQIDPISPQSVHKARQSFSSPVLPGLTIRLVDVFRGTS